MKDVFSRCFSLSLSLSLLHVKKGVSISRSLITIRILDTVYFEPISRFRFDTQEYGGIDRRSLVVIGASFVEFRYLIRPSRGNSWQENLACKYFPLISQPRSASFQKCRAKGYIINKRTFTRTANGTETWRRLGIPRAPMFASRSEINGLTFCAASLFDALVYRLTNSVFSIALFAMCIVLHVFRVYTDESRVNHQPHEKLYNRVTPRSR